MNALLERIGTFALEKKKKEENKKKEEMANVEDGSMFWTWKTIPSPTLSPVRLHTKVLFAHIFSE